MEINQFTLLKERRFLPLFITQFLSALNDNLFKNGLVVLITYVMTDQLRAQSQILVTLTGSLLILPMLLFSAQAGSIADKFEKAKLFRIIKLSELFLMLIGGIAFITMSPYLLMTILFFMGLQATFFGPLKYSILPQHLKENELIAGNGLIEMGTFLAILLGNILGVIFITLPHGLFVLAAALCSIALVAYLSSCFIPPAAPPVPQLRLSLNFIKETVNIVNYTKKTPVIYMCILGISWFWLIGFTFLAQFPHYVKDFVRGNEQVFVLFLAIFTVGIAIGSSLCNKLLNGKIEATFVLLAAFGITFFTFDLCLTTAFEPAAIPGTSLLSLKEFFYNISHWRIICDMLLIAIYGGIYIVPLYAILQQRSANTHRARVIASNNVMNSLFMIIAAIAAMAMLALKFTIPQIFLLMAVVNLLVAFQIFKKIA